MKKINLEDIIQICIGSSILAIPVAFTEEAWKLGNSIPMFKITLIFITSLTLNACFIYYGIYEGNLKNKGLRFAARVFINYFLTLVTVTYILYLLDVLVITDNLNEWISRIILISFPASLGGAVIDSFDKE